MNSSQEKGLSKLSNSFKPNQSSIITGDRIQPICPENFPLVIILDNLRSAFNVGNIFRLAEALRANEIIGCGYTALPPHPKLIKTARGCDEFLPSRHCITAAEAIRDLQEKGYHIFAVETAEPAVSIWEWQARFPLALVFGNEALGISEEIISLCQGAIRLPAYGRKNSINVGNCAAVVIHEARRQWEKRAPLTSPSL